MAAFPLNVKIGPFVYAITDGKDDMNAACRREKSDLLGACDFRSLIVFVDPDQADMQKRETLLHEMLHALTDLVGHGDDDELLVRVLAPALLALLRENPTIVKYLTSAA